LDLDAFFIRIFAFCYLYLLFLMLQKLRRQSTKNVRSREICAWGFKGLS